MDERAVVAQDTLADSEDEGGTSHNELGWKSCGQGSEEEGATENLINTDVSSWTKEITERSCD